MTTSVQMQTRDSGASVASAPLKLVYRDTTMVAIDKPTGWLVHRSNVDRRESRFVLQRLRDQIGQRVYPVHRLDKPTSGLMVFALDSRSAGALSTAFRDHRVTKRYRAVVRGHLHESGVIDHAFIDRADEFARSSSAADTRGTPPPASTNFRPLARAEIPLCAGRYPTSRYTLVELCPATGRKHQLRRHMKHLSHPIVGDTTYGDGRHNRLFRDHFGSNRLLLRAVSLDMAHPLTGHRLALQVGAEPGFDDLLAALGLAFGASPL